MHLKKSASGEDAFHVLVRLPNKVQAERLVGKWRELYVVKGVESAEWKFA